MFRRVYLDNSATTPIDPKVLEAMMPYLTDKFGNASSLHFFGQEARSAIEKARHQTAALLNARPNEIIFTSGGTESNNLAIRGLAQANGHHGKHIITSIFEHPSVTNVCEDLEKQGFEVTYLPVYERGLVRLEDIKAAVREDTILISIMTANNEIGTVQPIAEIGRFVAEMRDGGKKIWFHTDAVQAAGKIPVDVEAFGCDLLSISGHKIYAPKGIGALYVRKRVRLHPQNIGGSQQRRVRSGTESVPIIAAIGAACELVSEEITAEAERLCKLRSEFEQGVFEMGGDVVLNGDAELRIPNISNISFGRVEGEALLINLDMQGIAVSTGSACSSGSLEASPVILALGRADQLARGAVRFSFGRFNTNEDVARVLEVLPASVETLRKLSGPK